MWLELRACVEQVLQGEETDVNSVATTATDPYCDPAHPRL